MLLRPPGQATTTTVSVRNLQDYISNSEFLIKPLPVWLYILKNKHKQTRRTSSILCREKLLMMHRYILTVTYPSITVDYKAGGGDSIGFFPSPQSGSSFCLWLYTMWFVSPRWLFTRLYIIHPRQMRAAMFYRKWIHNSILRRQQASAAVLQLPQNAWIYLKPTTRTIFMWEENQGWGRVQDQDGIVWVMGNQGAVQRS